MNAEKLNKLKDQVRIGGKGTVRRKKKVIHRNTTDDKKLQSTLKKLNATNIPGIEEVNIHKTDGTVLQFNNPKVQASLGSNTFAISGHAETKDIKDLMPNLLRDLKPEDLGALKSFIESRNGAAAAASLAEATSAAAASSQKPEDVPEVESFEDSKTEA